MSSTASPIDRKDGSPIGHEADAAPLFTVGYQGATAASLFGRLRDAGVRTLIDVRDVAFSRRPEFRGPALARAAVEAGIAYIRLAGLGTPRDGRQAAAEGRRDAFVAILEQKLAGPAGRAALAEATRLIRDQGPVCLLCLEREPEQCHRSLIAARLAADLGVAVRPLFVVPRLL